ncbi:TonB-dependent receptor [Mucilaginibacter sp. UR6-11]|uniref:SusC/RagA family TonB-linked outer membrane protein n=1 Tax=Mucilaginibacter sp. UR6-11 TaxID=1435644 RepID=UPI001E4F4079|nr:TonB-dependent receptor [Mucilaginibacter sp. UR6-11]MCC8423680.1 TonB-dependent receptor [Mucilaginibacter sp. UR6-11]
MAKSLARGIADERRQAPISGTVTDAKGEPLPGVVVSVKNGTAATTTDVKGNFSIEANVGDVLVIKLIGFTTKEIPVTGNTALNVTLEESNTGLNEVVVIGYGTQKKRDLTGAVSSVKTSDLVLGQGPEIGNMLKGKIAGVTIVQNSAQPGGGLDILVRGNGNGNGPVHGSSEPLYVVDGFPISDLTQPSTNGKYDAGTQSVLTSFNPNDIESIEVLKDASATAIYGSRAASGVILITTKHGADGKAKVDYSANYTYQKFKNPFDVLPLNEWMQVRNEQGQEQWNFDNHVAPYGTTTVAEAIATSGPYRKLYTQNAINNVGRGTDWIKLVTRNGATLQQNLSISGGAKATKYFVSANYYDQDGVIKNSGLKRYSLRTNIDQDLSKILKLSVNLTASRIDNLNSQLGGDQYENSGVIRAAIQQGPHIQAIDEDGNYPINPQLALQPNPYSLLTITDKGRVERLLLNTYLDITPIKDLVIRLKAGVDRGSTLRQSYIPTSTLAGALEHGRAFVGNASSDNYLLEATANYKKTIAHAHNFELLGGVSKQKFIDQSSSAGATGFITDAFLWNNLGAGTNIQTPASAGSNNEIASYFGRFNYNYNSRYLFTATVRTDGASVFARNHKWGTFPSAAVAWNVAEEPFFAKMKNTVSQLKFRFSYGQTGNASIVSDNIQYSNAFAAYSAYSAYLSGSDTRLTGVSLSRLEDPDLKWETTTAANLGLDFSLFNGRVDGSVEVFRNVVSDLLDVKKLNSYQEINTILYNVGKTLGKGIEVSINVRNIKTENFQWRTLYTFSKYKNNWKERSPDWKPNVYESAQDPIRSNYNYVSDGILQIGETPPVSQPLLLPGMIKVKDINGYVRDAQGNPVVDANGRFLRTGKPDGIIDNADEKLFGTTDPSAMAGITNIFTYKRFSLNFDFNGLFGRSMQDPNYVTYGVSAYGIYSNGYNALRTVKNRWTPTNPTNSQPSSFYGFSPYPVGDFFMENAWFIRLQNVSIGYDIPVKWAKGAVSSIRFHLDGQNIFVITPYKGVDPETDSYTAAYPNIRSFLAGINVTF